MVGSGSFVIPRTPSKTDTPRPKVAAAAIPTGPVKVAAAPKTVEARPRTAEAWSSGSCSGSSV